MSPAPFAGLHSEGVGVTLVPFGTPCVSACTALEQLVIRACQLSCYEVYPTAPALENSSPGSVSSDLLSRVVGLKAPCALTVSFGMQSSQVLLLYDTDYLA